MNNICTTVEQSKRLLELGLNPLTSDMYWGLKGSLMHPSDEYELNIRRDPAIEHNLFSYREGYTIPAWSFLALTDLMPEKIGNCVMVITKCMDDLGFSYVNEYNQILTIQDGDNSMEGAVNMICWLIKNNHIKLSSSSPSDENK